MGGGGIDDLYKMIVSILSFVILFNFTQKYKMYGTLNKMFQMFGRESLSIYVIQFYLCKFLGKGTIDVNLNPLILFIIVFLVSIPLCFLCSWLSLAIKSNKYLELLFLGKK